MKKLVEAAESAPIEKVVAAGIKPSNPGYAPAMQTCNTYANLRRGFSCTLQDQEGNPIETMCDESFAIVQNGQWTKIAPDEALDYIASRSAEVRTIAEETQDGFKKRQTAIAKELPAAGASTDGGSSDQVSPAESGTSGNNTQKQCRDTPSFSDCLMQGMMNGQSSQVYGPSCRARYC